MQKFCSAETAGSQLFFYIVVYVITIGNTTLYTKADYATKRQYAVTRVLEGELIYYAKFICSIKSLLFSLLD